MVNRRQAAPDRQQHTKLTNNHHSQQKSSEKNVEPPYHGGSMTAPKDYRVAAITQPAKRLIYTLSGFEDTAHV